MRIRRWVKKVENGFSKRALALCYHRIAETEVDPWELAVSPENFEEQLQVLQAYRVLPVGDLIHKQRAQKLPSTSLCLTFDDGYVDNATLAKPLLEKYETPAGFFIATGYTGLQELFWWDELALIILQSESLPERLLLQIGINTMTFNFEESCNLDSLQNQQHRSWVYSDTPPTERCRLYLQIWEQLRRLPADEIQSAISQIRQWAGFDPSQHADSFPMKKGQVQDIAAHPLFEVGIHTVSHCNLAAQPASTQRDEIVTCKVSLDKDYEISATIMTYPYGKYNAATIDIVQELNFTGAFTTCGEAITHKSDPYQLGRVVVKNWNGEAFEKQLRSWINNL